jgi:hypothetical protein
MVKTLRRAESKSKGILQGGNLSPLLYNIYMHEFDEWVINTLTPEFEVGKRKKANPEYTKLVRKGKNSIKGRLIMPTLDEGFKRLKYIRYADDFLIGVIGSKMDCIELINKIKIFLKERLGLTLNVEKTKITNASQDSAKFLGYNIHITPPSKQIVRRVKPGRLTRLVGRPVFDAPIKSIADKLESLGFVHKRTKMPTRNGKFTHHTLPDLINHYKTVEYGIRNYYRIANNFGRLAARVH